MFLNINHVGALAVVPVLKDALTLLHIWVNLENSEDLTEAGGKDVEGLDQKKKDSLYLKLLLLLTSS